MSQAEACQRLDRARNTVWPRALRVSMMGDLHHGFKGMTIVVVGVVKKHGVVSREVINSSLTLVGKAVFCFGLVSGGDGGPFVVVVEVCACGLPLCRHTEKRRCLRANNFSIAVGVSGITLCVASHILA